MNTYRVFVKDMPHQDVKAEGYEVDVDTGCLVFWATVPDHSTAVKVATFRDWSFVKMTDQNDEAVLSKKEWKSFMPVLEPKT